MKKIFACVSVIIMCVAMSSCGVNDDDVRAAIAYRLAYERKAKAYDRAFADSLNKYDYDEKLDIARQELEQARKIYLVHFASMNADTRIAYQDLEKECISVDKEYLGSIYEDEDSADETKWHKLEVTYTNVMK